MTILTYIRICIATLVLTGLASFGMAQTDTTAMEDIVKSATDSGMQVIVINPDTGPNTDADPLEDRFQGSILMKSQERAAAFRTTLRNRVSRAPEAMEEIVFILNGQSPSGSYLYYFAILFSTLAFLIAGEIVVGLLFTRILVRRWFTNLQKPDPIGYTDKLPILLFRALLATVGLILVVIVSYGIGYFWFGEAEDGTVRLTVLYIYVTYFTARAVVFIWRMMLTPYLPQYRIPHFEDQDARRLFYWLLFIATISIIVVNFSAWMQELGLSYDIHALLTSFLTLLVVFLNFAMVVRNHRSISTAILAGQAYEDASLPARFASRAWAPVIIIYFFVAWAEMTYRLIEAQDLGSPLISGFYMILITVLVVYAIVGYLIERIFQRQRLVEEYQARLAEERESQGLTEGPETGEIGEDEAEQDGEFSPFLHTHKMRTFEDLSRRVANILAIIAAAWAITRIWHIDLSMMSNSAFSRSYDLVIVVFIGYVIYHFVRIWIDQRITEEGGDDIEVAPGDEGGAGDTSRLATLLPLFRNFLLVVIFTTFALIGLTNLGINVSALFAGAGVVGLAIGFGAQSLVRDIFSGAFFLFDDAFRKGEYIDVGAVKGTVEKISVRSFQLRHHLGPLHTIPFGEIQHLTNFSRDWVMMKLPLRVTYDTDVEQVRKLIKKLGLALLEDEVVGDQFIQPLKSQGVIEMQDSAMIIRVKFMTKPGDQWILRKRVYAEIRELFAREGIKFAHKEVTVRLAGADAKNLSDDDKKAIGAAALSASEDEDLLADNDVSGDDR